MKNMSKRKVSNSKTIVDDDNVARYMECLCACSYIEQNMHHVHGTVRYNSIVDLETFPRHDWIRPQEHKLYNHSSQPRVQKKCVGTDSKPVMSVRHLSSLLLVAGTCFLTSCQIFPYDIARPARGRITYCLKLVSQATTFGSVVYCTKNVFHCPCWHTYIRYSFCFLGSFL